MKAEHLGQMVFRFPSYAVGNHIRTLLSSLKRLGFNYEDLKDYLILTFPQNWTFTTKNLLGGSQEIDFFDENSFHRAQYRYVTGSCDGHVGGSSFTLFTRFSVAEVCNVARSRDWDRLRTVNWKRYSAVSLYAPRVLDRGTGKVITLSKRYMVPSLSTGGRGRRKPHVSGPYNMGKSPSRVVEDYAKRFLNRHFPDWKDVFAYWGSEIELNDANL